MELGSEWVNALNLIIGLLFLDGGWNPSLDFRHSLRSGLSQVSG